MKKYFFIFILFLVIAFSVLHATAQSSGSRPLFSFRGVLSGILQDIAEGAQNIVSGIHNPFSKESKAAPTQAAALQTNSNGAFTFAIIGDTKVFSAKNPDGNLEKAVKSIEKQNPNFALVMGDLISSCDGGSKCADKFEEWKGVMGDLLPKTYEVVGNHDWSGSSADAIWQNAFTLPENGPDGYKEMVYSFDFGNSHFVVLDSEKPKMDIVNDVQRNWLEKDLTANKKENVFIFFHEPAYQVAQSTEDGLDAQPDERDALWNVFKKYNVKYVFNGHSHLFSEKKIGNIYQIVEGDTDSTNDDYPLAGFADYAYKGKAYSMVQVDGTKVTLNLYSVDGNLIKTIDLI